MHKPRFPLRWRHRFARMLTPRTWQGRLVQLGLATAVLIATLLWTGHVATLVALWTRWTS
ncbi:hypothetical protein [Rhodoplanes roseus]|uniref:Uncharacterized protein n=1 Tax=Rhodoplanes roseus TaxID=29409 RepID=A0A327KS25_9BRAD|nr:hypothetical protein [Rhodoplanes roseus]RAI40092.1 hypothetical protein CH341_24510 [Rhodoplanes roseus]